VQQDTAEFRIVPQSRLQLPTRKLISTSSSFSLTRDLEQFGYRNFQAERKREFIDFGSGLTSRPGAEGKPHETHDHLHSPEANLFEADLSFSFVHRHSSRRELRQRRSLFRRACPLAVSHGRVGHSMRRQWFCPYGLKSASPWIGRQHMDTRVAGSAISKIEVISWTAITIVMGLILTVIGASIYGSLGIAQ
jgi:hypothetical protein